MYTPKKRAARKEWTAEEDDTLKNGVNEHGTKFKNILEDARYKDVLKDRTYNMLYTRWKKLKTPPLDRNKGIVTYSINVTQHAKKIDKEVGIFARLKSMLDALDWVYSEATTYINSRHKDQYGKDIPLTDVVNELRALLQYKWSYKEESAMDAEEIENFQRASLDPTARARVIERADISEITTCTMRSYVLREVEHAIKSIRAKRKKELVQGKFRKSKKNSKIEGALWEFRAEGRQQSRPTRTLTIPKASWQSKRTCAYGPFNASTWKECKRLAPLVNRPMEADVTLLVRTLHGSLPLLLIFCFVLFCFVTVLG